MTSNDNVIIPYNRLCAELFRDNPDIPSLILDVYSDLEEEQVAFIAREINKRFLSRFNLKKKEAHYIKERFFEKNKEWLEGEISINIPGAKSATSKNRDVNGGRPSKSFEECCKKAQKYKVEALRKSVSQSLIDAASTSTKCDCRSQKPFDADEALALIIQTKLTKADYETIRKATKNHGYNMFPSYNKVLEAKKKCYPANIQITESAASVPLQNLLDHTVKRILETKSETELLTVTNQSLTLHSKWGCDGASGQSEFMQKFSNTDPSISDSHLFMTSFVPLIISLDTGRSTDSRIFWKNERPSSTRYCRPVQYQFKKETPALILEEKSRMENEIQALRETIFEVSSEHSITVKHEMYMTMIDGKTAQVVTHTSSSSNCVVCGAKPTTMNKLEVIRGLPVNQEALKLGMSSLHARIRFMEYVLHLSYNLDFQRWRTNEETRAIQSKTKKRVQEGIYNKIGIKVDVVKQGVGTTNDGNVSRRFFENPTIIAEITRVNEELITRLGTILQVICSTNVIDSQKFGEYGQETAQLAIREYPWYNLPPSVHKILIHGKDIIDAAVLPIGTLSEEAQEHRNKDYRYFRIYNSRKCSPLATNEDVIHYMLLSSDPKISFLRPEPDKTKLDLSPDALQMIIS